MVSKLGFIFTSTLFFLFIVNISAMLGASVIDGFEIAEFTSSGNWFLDLLTLVYNNLQIFINLIGTSSSFALFNGIILVAYSLGLVWAILELARGV